MGRNQFKIQYGPYAVIAGASQGIGEAFAYSVAKRGVNLILIARREAELEQIATHIMAKYPVIVISYPLDLLEKNLEDHIHKLQDTYEIGLLIYNAALSPIGKFVDQALETHVQVINLNCRGPMTWAHSFLPRMCQRKRGGVILMSSLTAFQGSPYVGHYGATKAYNLNLAEALWDECRPFGVHVMAVIAGATSTPNFLSSAPKIDHGIKPPIMTPEQVAEQSLTYLPRNRPLFIPGSKNRLSSFFLRKILSRKLAVRIIGNVNRKMYEK